MDTEDETCGEDVEVNLEWEFGKRHFAVELLQ